MRRIFLLLVLALAACSPPWEPLPTASADWTSIRFTQSGGMIGMLSAIEISRDGAWIATDERDGATASGKLSDAEQNQLSALIATLRIQSDQQSGVCADCFIYSLEIFSASETLSAEADDVNLQESGLGALAMFLGDLLDRALTR